jgi:hypothetical protein
VEKSSTKSILEKPAGIVDGLEFELVDVEELLVLLELTYLVAV